MISPDAILAGADWPALSHAYGDAGDLPGRLVGLLSDDPETAADALAVLETAVLRQGSIYTSTAPVALFVAAITGDPRTRPHRAALLRWLGQVADSASWGEPDPESTGSSCSGSSSCCSGSCCSGGDDEEERAVAACREIRHEVYRTVALYLEDPDPAIRSAALGAAGHLLIAPDLAEYRPAAADRLQHDSAGQPETDRANTALTLARWGIAPAALLGDPSAAVRAHAALAAALDDDPRALAEVRSALRDPATADRWLPGTLLDGRLRFALIRALLRRTRDFTTITAEALAVAAMTNQYTVDNDWGPLLQRAFPIPYAGSLTPAQRAFLTALAANRACWGTTGNRTAWLRRAGLPADRADLQALLAAA